MEAVEQREPLNLGEFAAHEGAFALEVSGDSVIDDHICDGDIVVALAPIVLPAREVRIQGRLMAVLRKYR